MSRLRHRLMGAVMAASVGAPYVITPVLAQALESHRNDSVTVSRNISMGVGKSLVVDLPRDAAEIVVGNPGVANAVVRTPRKLFIMGAGQGQTTVFALDSQGRQFANFEISIGRDVGDLGPLLKAALPKSEITTRTVNDTIILTGWVSSPGDAQRAVDIAKGFASQVAAAGASGQVTSIGAGGAPIINALQIRGEDQVMLKVTVAEVSRTVLKQLGVSAGANGEAFLSGSWGTFTNHNPFAINAVLSQSAFSFTGPNGTSHTLQAFERYNVARVLAEPSVSAVSGENAKVVVGGEIAVPAQGSCIAGNTPGATTVCTPGITFKPYGVTLAFTPVVQAEGRIQIHLNTEVTEVDYSSTQTYLGVSVPGFKTRKNETTVELPSGGSMATAGLLTHASGQAINGIPGLINLPVLGALFRSRDYQRNESELLVVVTPYIIKSVSSHEVVRPDDHFNDASDPQAWLLGRVNRIYATRNNPQLNQNYKGRIGFIHD
ncbi:type II and III secretion system protein family protein [Methylocystis heyeri]|uniref:Secretin n=1 Tax=Methylocystis heyeri TaxID=391905 RepID=A0A6B8KEX2_9HYPH|nr:type II and III secretion system protein family protein [Methylocystis heyeri]QGM46172.1 secretin [Methylocystis heyeri]